MDVRNIILKKYKIDIAQTDICKLYKLDKSEISVDDLEKKIAETRKRWNQSINGANEKNAERDRERLSCAEIYEKILRDDQLRSELFKYYNSGKATEDAMESDSYINDYQLAETYFDLISSSHRIGKSDVEFFYEYYGSLIKNKKKIDELLKKQYKVLLKTETTSNDTKKTETKEDDGVVVVNLFRKKSLILIQRIIDDCNEAATKDVVKSKYSHIGDEIYEFLELDKYNDIQAFYDYAENKQKEIFTNRQERGTDFIPLLDAFNKLIELLKQKDIKDNFSEFKILVKFHKLIPYMNGITEMKKGTFNKLIKIAQAEYSFRGETDFILTYYSEIYDNFGISNTGIGDLINKAHKKAKANKVFNSFGEVFGHSRKKSMPLGAKIMYGCLYWPIFLTYFVFETFKAFFTGLQKMMIPVGVFTFAILNIVLPENEPPYENIIVLIKTIVNSQWIQALETAGLYTDTTFKVIVASITYINLWLLVHVLPAIVVAMFTRYLSININKKYDWQGVERTFQKIFSNLWNKNLRQYEANRKKYWKNTALGAVINVAYVIALIIVIYFAKLGMDKLF